MPSIDEYLRRDAEHWRASIDATASLPQVSPWDEARERLIKRPTWRRYVLAGACAAVVLAFAVLAVTLGESGNGKSPSSGAQIDPKRPGVPTVWRWVPLKELPVVVDGMRDDISMPWRLLAIDDARDRIQIGYAAGDVGCVRASRVRVVQTARQVNVTVLAVRTHDQVCPAAFAWGRTWVALDDPVGRRTLVHEPSDQSWAQEPFFSR